jgi:hypothetical protein
MADESASTTLSIANGGITLENSKVAVVTLDPTKALGSSAFGPLLFRPIVNGVTGDWQPLATLVRLPALRELKCPASAELACKLSGASLFLVDSVSSEPGFTHAVQVPDGFPGYSLPVPHPNNGLLYVKLRDDPMVVSRATLTPQQLPPTAEEVARAAERQAASQAPSPSTGTEPAATAPASPPQAAPPQAAPPAAEQATGQSQATPPELHSQKSASAPSDAPKPQ